MKKIIVCVLLFGIGGAFNAFGQNQGADESVVVVNALFANLVDSMEVLVNSQKKADIKHNSPVTITVPNGNNIITLIALNGNLKNKAASKLDIQLNLNSERVVIEARINNLRKITETIKSRTKLNNSVSAPASAPATSSIEKAIETIVTQFKDKLPRPSTVAVLGVSSSDKDTAAFVIDELEYQLVNLNMFNMVDRNALEAIRNEQNFQMSGEVSDASAVTIGNMLGASIVITGSISGSGTTRRLTMRALDVATSQILAISREGF